MKFKIKNFRTIVDDVEIDFNQNNIISLIGINGSGKTNILEAINHFFKNIDNVVTKPIMDKTPSIELLEKISKEELKKLFDIKLVNDGDVYKKIIKKKNELLFVFNDDTDYFQIYKKNISDKLKKIQSNCKETEVINETRTFNGTSFYKINEKNISKLEETSKKTGDGIRGLLDKEKKLDEIFKNIDNLDFKYIKNADDENNVNFKYDITQYKNDKKTKNVIDFFDENAEEKIEKIIKFNDSTPDGEAKVYNLKNEFMKISEKKISEIFERLNIYARPIASFDGNDFKVNVKTKDNYEINDDIEISTNSSGYKSLFWLLLNFEIAIHSLKLDSNKKFIILADEPDKNLHPFLQQQLLNYVKDELLKKKNICFLYTTHSPFLIDENILNFVVSRSEKGHTTIKKDEEIGTGDIASIYTKIANLQLTKNSFIKNAPKSNNIWIKNDTQNIESEIKKYIKETYALDVVVENLQNEEFKEYPNIEKTFIECDHLANLKGFIQNGKIVFLPDGLIREILEKVDDNGSESPIINSALQKK